MNFWSTYLDVCTLEYVLSAVAAAVAVAVVKCTVGYLAVHTSLF